MLIDALHMFPHLGTDYLDGANCKIKSMNNLNHSEVSEFQIRTNHESCSNLFREPIYKVIGIPLSLFMDYYFNLHLVFFCGMTYLFQIFSSSIETKILFYLSLEC